jgi:endogenous inhibitor of DNA gyrase (YacG/DUF329 family)
MSEERFAVRCPHCSASIEHECPPKGETLPGSPLRKCPDCGRLFYDDVYQEPALKAYAHIGFLTAGECEMYNQHFLCYEKAL